MAKLRIGNRQLQISSNLEFAPQILSQDTKCFTLHMGCDKRWGLPYATRNLQTDSADFEAICFAIWSLLPDCRFELSYAPLSWGKCFPPDYENCDSRLLPLREKNLRLKAEKKKPSTDTPESRIRHYMRFLYRVMKMRKLYGDLFSVAKENRAEVDAFAVLYEKAMADGRLLMDIPKAKSDIKDGEGRKKNGESVVSENHLEKWFVLHPDCTEIVDACGEVRLFDQLPCSLFCGDTLADISKKNQLLNTGYFDLWGKNASELHLFELKRLGNDKLGVISELFFYSCLMKDFMQIAPRQFAANAVANSEKPDARGFDDFVAFAKENRFLRTHFLVPRVYSFFAEPEVREGLLRAMNRRADGVAYDFIVFDQNKLVGGESQAQIQDFLKKLKKEWNS